MDDLISRQEAIDWVKSESNPYAIPTLDFDSAIDVINHLKEMPSAQRWIPCSERLPKRKDETQMRGYYLTTNAYGSVGLTKYEFEGGGLGYAWDSYIRIVAWMPLPEPYKGENDG